MRRLILLYPFLKEVQYYEIPRPYRLSILNDNKEVPQIRLSGHWLESCGFRPGSKYTVNELSGWLLLMVEENKK
ncbi:MAG TPA: hypothetical protein DDW50_08915 [Firmicutes bacterium]|nr:hypothetical protein [Bacillota bacterium]